MMYDIELKIRLREEFGRRLKESGLTRDEFITQNDWGIRFMELRKSYVMDDSPELAELSRMLFKQGRRKDD